MLEQAVYGSETGLGDYRILAQSPGIDPAAADTIVRYSSLGGSAQTLAFAPIVSYFAIDGGRWVLSRTVCLGATSRGNDYLTHTVVIDAPAFLQMEGNVFALMDAGVFLTEKPAAGSLLEPLGVPAPERRVTATTVVAAQVIGCLRLMVAGPLRLRLEHEAQGLMMCRAIHDALPPSDRLMTTWCSRFSYERRLDFRVAGFVGEDHQIARQQAPEATVVALPVPVDRGAADACTAWMARQPVDRLIHGLSVLSGPAGAIATLDTVASLASVEVKTPGEDLAPLRPAAQLVLRPENRRVITRSAIWQGAVIVMLVTRAGELLRNPDGIAQLADWCACLAPGTRAEIRRRVKPSAIDSWMIDVLVRLPDESLVALTNALGSSTRGRSYIASVNAANPAACRAYLKAAFAAIRRRYPEAGASAMASLAGILAREPEAVRALVRAMEATATEPRDDGGTRVHTAWPMAIVREVAAIATLAPEVIARLVLTYDLFSQMTGQEVEAVAVTLLGMGGTLARRLDDRPLSQVPLGLLTGLAGPVDCRAPSPSLLRVVERLLRRIEQALSAGDASPALTGRATFILYKVTMQMPREPRRTLHDAMTGVVRALVAREVRPEESVTLIKSIERLVLVGESPVPPTALARLARHACQPTGARSVWNAARAQLRAASLRRVTT